jgi:N-acetylglutamate synthase-like GNAT family acetyltransferase
MTYKIRRATMDDIFALNSLWNEACLPAQNFERKFTDFQVAEDENGKIVAALGLQIEGPAGRIYGEAFSDFSLTDAVRPLLWDRMLVVAKNHGLFRLWTDEDALFWKHGAGFSEPVEAVLRRRPSTFESATNRWLTLQLRDEAGMPDALEKINQELEIFKQAGAADREAIQNKAKIINIVGTLLAAGLLVYLLAWLVRFIYSSMHGGR